eukprot:65284-Ditylum_brightwellii.AAC.1
MSSSQQEQDMAANINKEEAEEEEKEEEESRLDKCSIATKENGGGKAVRFTDTVIITATGGKVSPKVEEEEEEESQNVGNAQTAVSVDDGTSKDGKESGEKSNNNDNEDSLLGK